MAKVVEYKPKKTVYGTIDKDKRTNEEKEFDRNSWRNDIIKFILSFNPKIVYKTYAHLIDIVDGDFKWKEEKIKELDDLALISCNTICSNAKDLNKF